MQKTALFLGAVLGVFFVYNIHLGNITVHDAFETVSENGENLVSVMEKAYEKEKITKKERGQDDNFSVLAFGDMMLGRHVRVLMDQYGKDYIFEKLKNSDQTFFEGMGVEPTEIVFGNLEGPIKGQGKKGGTAMNFAFNEDVAGFLKENGINLVSIANNHAVDAGWDGRATTMKALKDAGVGFCGHPSEADFDSVYYGKSGEKYYAFVCFHNVNFPLDEIKAGDLVASVAQNVDYLIVSVHWGNEYQHMANKKQVELGKAWIDAGADLVIGHHPHVVQNFEIYKGRLIFYSLGNFVFDQYWSKDTQEELALRVEFKWDEGLETSVQIIPMKSEKSQSRLMTEKEKIEWMERFIKYGEYSQEMKTMIRSGVIEVFEE